MPPRSSIERDPVIREAVDAALTRGCTQADVVSALLTAGKKVSKSAVGRYALRYEESIKRQRQIQEATRCLVDEAQASDDTQSRVFAQLVTTLATRAILPLIEDEDVELSLKDLSALTQMSQRVTKTQGNLLELQLRAAREAERKETARQAADVAETAGRAAGASEETLRKIRTGILGLSS
ncbi:phage protein Gp27 family protein [Sphingomonas sp. SRS2]|uniref:phage protein Gp27 family protein n=1 Tax=Sphingomonas sp. SRS2 TaxID=133190 RepID=UPI0006183FC2|nr:phage protein Gp27 family protein [Sphingomonas sp. SRS2]KKC27418.1 hypothetical protein WP12_03280 [Sphingomonas sp. SRS2]